MPARALSRISYVEDDEDIQHIVRLSLERIGGLSVDIIGDPARAIERMVEFKPDLVVLDWMMPKIDGPTLCRQMRARSETRDLPVVFVTAKASPHELEELRALGAAGTISKPFSPMNLPAQLRAIWDSCAARGPLQS